MHFQELQRIYNLTLLNAMANYDQILYRAAVLTEKFFEVII